MEIYFLANLLYLQRQMIVFHLTYSREASANGFYKNILKINDYVSNKEIKE